MDISDVVGAVAKPRLASPHERLAERIRKFHQPPHPLPVEPGVPGWARRRERRESSAWVNRTMRIRERAARFQSGRPVIAGRTNRLRLSGAFGVAAVAAAELLYPSGRVEDARLPGVERVTRR
jgi:hypothetical protein